jgi:AcrR family transcriptional regulator
MSIAETSDRITQACLRLVVAKGVRNTSLTDVAYEAGVTRVTVHRYCRDKQGLIRLVLRRIVAIFVEAGAEPIPNSIETIDSRLTSLGQKLAILPRGNLLARFEEIQRLYPDVYKEFRDSEREAIDRIFGQVLAVAMGDQSLRPGINVDVLKIIFLASTVGMIEVPTLISSNVSLAEIFTTVSEVFRHGILKEPLREGD